MAKEVNKVPASCPSDTKLLKSTLRHPDSCNLFVIQPFCMTYRETPRTVSDSDSSSRSLATIKGRPSTMAFGSTHQPTAHKASTTSPIHHRSQHHQTSTHHNHNYTPLHLQHITPTKCVSPATLQSTPSAPTKTAIKSSPLTTASPTTAGHLHTTCPSPLIPTTTNSAATISPFFKTVPRSTSGHQRMEISAENATHCGKRRRSRE
jgi:hypothetical protein